MARINRGVVIVGWFVVSALPVTAQQASTTGGRGATPRATVARIDAPRILPGTRADVFTTIQGNALTSTNASLANAVVRLRDARVGQIVGTQVTDGTGLFAFRLVDPGSYIVEIVDATEYGVLAASQVLNAGPGEAVSAIVKLPFRTPPFAGVLGNTTPTAATVTNQAAAAGIMAAQVAGAPTCDQLQ
jgi:hypothetical protein